MVRVFENKAKITPIMTKILKHDKKSRSVSPMASPSAVSFRLQVIDRTLTSLQHEHNGITLGYDGQAFSFAFKGQVLCHAITQKGRAFVLKRLKRINSGSC